MIRRLRNAPSGTFIGDPGLRVGPNSVGLIWRAHGDAAPSQMPTASAASLDGLSAIVVDMEPNYLYQLELAYPVYLAATATANVDFSNYYRVHYASTSTWGSWVLMTNQTHSVNANATFGGYVETIEKTFGVSVTAPIDMIGFGVLGGAAAAGVASINNRGSWAIVSEYQT
jgi:hypothetical protein